MSHQITSPIHTAQPHRTRTLLLAAAIQIAVLLFITGAFVFPRGQLAVPGQLPSQSLANLIQFTNLTSGANVSDAALAQSLPPPPRDALPYEVRVPLSNGPNVVVKKRWVWVPAGKAIAVTTNADGQFSFYVPDGTKLWKDFYLETDQGAFLIERRIVLKVPTTVDPSGWQLFNAHYQPALTESSTEITLASNSVEAENFFYSPTDSLLTQAYPYALRVAFEDATGQSYAYVFPGQNLCLRCHAGASGAYPDADSSPVYAFGLHPNNLAPESLAALEARGWITGSDLLQTTNYPLGQKPVVNSLDTLTPQVVAVLRNNCASCHNASPIAMARGTAFILDPNKAYSTDELLTLLSVQGKMMGITTKQLVVPGDPANSEIMLRLQGLEGRRRMPPAEGGLAEPEAHIIELMQAWILATGATP